MTAAESSEFLLQRFLSCCKPLLLASMLPLQKLVLAHIFVHELFERQAAAAPDAVALVYEGAEMTYAALDARATAVAVRLQAAGVVPDTLVGLMLPRSFDMVVAIWGILKAGGAYVPIDPEYPEERVRFIVADAGLRVLVTHGALSRADVEANVCLDVKDGSSSLTSIRHGVVEQRVRPTDLAYMIYTGTITTMEGFDH